MLGTITKKWWSKEPNSTRQCGSDVHQPVILPLLRARGLRCSVKPASRSTLFFRDLVTKAFAQITKSSSQLGTGGPGNCTDRPCLAGYHRNNGNTNKARRNPGRSDDDVQADQGNRGSSQRKINEQSYLTIGCESERISSTQVGSLPEGGSFDGAPANGGVIVEKDAILTVKNHVLVFEELVTETDRAIQTDSESSNSKTIPTDCVLDNNVISSNLIEIVVMDEDTVILNRDLIGKQSEQISPPVFEVSKKGFKVGCGNVIGNKTTSKGRPKRSGNIDKGVG
ncbi:hypothetical protein CMV_012983 [Castanea mollissima]|uniref:Uncharacterized protein n=1 Tax=Castanea mollissima TaxID=60419 RepID=A0A8J4R9A6_9ROSI|nr:hypothetical protein CMV_012983 [Castanea mollissima]